MNLGETHRLHRRKTGGTPARNLLPKNIPFSRRAQKRFGKWADEGLPEVEYAEFAIRVIPAPGRVLAAVPSGRDCRSMNA